MGLMSTKSAEPSPHTEAVYMGNNPVNDRDLLSTRLSDDNGMKFLLADNNVLTSFYADA